MEYSDFIAELNMKNNALSITRMEEDKTCSDNHSGCLMNMLNKAIKGEVIYFTQDTKGCPGGKCGLGFMDDIPTIKGGFGYFLSMGRGDGFPKGERIKCSCEVGEMMMQNQPKKVMEGFSSICVKSYEPSDNPDLVTCMVNADQLSALIHIFNFRKPYYDNIIVPMCSGCASVFRIPFAESSKEQPRAVVGNVDVCSRPYFPEETLFFTVSGRDFKSMLKDSEEGIFKSYIWKSIRERLHKE